MPKIESLISSIAKPAFKVSLRGGLLHIAEKDCPVYTIGDGNGPVFTMRINSWATLLKILNDPDLYLGETYVAGGWDLTQGDLGQFLTWLAHNNKSAILHAPAPDRHDNNLALSKRNIAHHYDLGNDLYKAFLDDGMNYSCAFFEDHRMSLRDAQLNKIYTTIGRADIRPGMKILDIGCGWGELTRIVPGCVPDVQVTGITLSEHQLSHASSKIQNFGSSRADYKLADYRSHARENPGTYDRIISIGMFEHVGRNYYDDYFKAISGLLKPGGKALVHSIMRPEPGYGTSKWLDTYIFPGGCIPYMPETLEIAQKQGLSIAGTPFVHESYNYAETLRRWRSNFNARYETLDSKRYDRRFARIWNFYLASCEASFDGIGYYIAQMVFEKP